MAKGLSIGRAGLKGLGLIVLAAAAAGAGHFAWSSLLEPLEAPNENGLTGRASAPGLQSLRPAEKPGFKPEMLIARPLFSPDRRPPTVAVFRPPPAETTMAPAIEPPPPYLIGGVIVSARLSRALLRRQPREPGRWFTLGEMTDEGWTVSAITADSVVLARSGREFSYSLHPRTQ